MADNIDPKQIDELNENLRGLIETLGGVAQSTGSVGAANKEASFNTKLATKGLASLGTSVADVTKAMYDGKKGASAFNGAVQGAADALSLLVLAIPGLGLVAKVAALAIGAFAKGIQAANKQGDALYKSYQELSKSGATASDGITGVFNNMQKFGYGIEELDKMVQLVSANSETLAKFSLTAADGTNAYASAMQSIVRDPALKDLGKTPDQINAAGAAFIRQQVAIGRSQKDVGDTLGASTKQYVMDLDRLQRLTGTSADQLQKQQDEAMSEDAYNDVMADLEARAKSGDANATAQIKKITTTMASLSPEMQKEFQKSIGGDISAQQKLMMRMPSLMKNVMDESVGIGQTMNDAKQDITGYVDTMGKSYRLNSEGMREYGGTLRSAREEITQFGNWEEREKAADKNATVTDQATKNLSKIDLANMNSRDALQSFVQLGVAPATTAMAALAGVTEKATRVLPGEKTGAATGKTLTQRINETINDVIYGKGAVTAPGAAGLGAVSAKFEGAGAGTVGSGKGDYGGASYGTYQMSSNMGQVQKFLKENEKYGKEFEGLTAGTEDFNKKWKELGGDKGFAEAQQAFAKKQYYDAQVQTLGDLGKKLTGKGRGVQEALFSTGVQYGGGSKLIEKALSGKDVDKMGEKDIINAIQDYKAQNVSTNFRSSSADVQRGVANRIERERAALMASSTAGPLDGYASQMANVDPSKTLPEKQETQTANNLATAGDTAHLDALNQVVDQLAQLNNSNQQIANSTKKSVQLQS